MNKLTLLLIAFLCCTQFACNSQIHLPKSGQPGQELTAAQPIPKGMVAFIFDPTATCPTGWKEAQYAQGRLLMAVNTPDSAMISIGTPIQDSQPPVHDHPYTATAAVGYKGTSSIGGSDKGVGASGNYPLADTTFPASLGFPFIQFQVCEYFASDTTNDAFPVASVAFFNRPSCPQDWTADPNYNGRFILPIINQAGAGTVTAEYWTPSSPPVHQHQVSGSLSLSTLGFVWGGGANTALASPGQQGIYGGAAPNTEAIVPYVSLLACRKSTFSLNNDTLSSAISVFYSADNCPDGWARAPGSGGRFVFGLPGGGVQGAAFGGNPIASGDFSGVPHQHNIDGEVIIYNHNTDLTRTWHNLSLGADGVYGYSATAQPFTITLPYVSLSHCVYWPGQGN